MTFFYDLNKRLADLANKQQINESTQPAVAEGSTGDYSAKKASAGKDIGKPGKMFSKIAKSAGKRYGSKESGEKVAGAVLAKLRTKEDVAQEGNAFTGALKATPKGGKFKVGGKEFTDTSSLEEVGMTPKQKSFAKLAPPKDKITFADKIAGAKKEVDEMLGDVAAEAIKKAVKKSEPRSKGTAFDPEVAKGMFAHKDEHPRHDVKDTGYSKRYTRKAEPEEKDDAEVSDQPKKKGRPKGPEKGPERTTKGAWKHKGTRKEKTEEDLDTDGVMMTRQSNMSSEDIDSVALADKGEYDQEGDMAKDQLHTLTQAAEELSSILSDEQNLPEWVQSKITKALDYINAVNDYMDQERHDDEDMVAEKAVSKKQRRAAGIAHAAQKGEIPKKELRGASKEMAKMPKGELKKFAATKEKGLPEKAKAKKEESVEETSEAPKEKKSSGGYNFGGGVYESLDRQFAQALTEGMNITVNMGTGDGESRKSITVTAEGEEAEALAQLLKMAGLGGSAGAESCPTCGTSPCGCATQVDENQPDWPTNTETSNDALQYSGGLNKPKSTGQTTVPVIASQLRRQVSMEEGVELERSLFKLYQNYKAK